MRYYNSDFIVEERAQNNKIIFVNDLTENNNQKPGGSSDPVSMFAHLIKIGITTNIAVERVKAALKIKKNIGYAGLKDEFALTAQAISFPKTKLTVEEIKKIKIPNIHLTNFSWQSGFLRPGYLDGNHFTITIRTKDKVNEAELATKLETISKYGFLNYFQSQRFGGVRLDSHKIGKLIMQGKYELAIRFLLFRTNEYEMPLIASIKKQGEKFYPNLEKVVELFNQLPYSLFYELKVLNYLNKNSEDFIGALKEIKDSITICIYAYSSLLFNKHLSIYSRQKGCIDEKFPLLISTDRRDHQIYANYLREDETENFMDNLRNLRFIYFNKRELPGRIIPKDINFKLFSGGVVVKFFLPKGVYATTLLANLFKLSEDRPIPTWVDNSTIDPIALFGQGNLDNIKGLFNDYWNKA